MKKAVIAVMLVAGSVMAVDDAATQAAVAKAVDKAPVVVASAQTVDSGIVAVPTSGGAIVSSDVGQTAKSIGKVGFWQTIKNVPSSYPKTTTALTALAVAIPILANNPKLIGIKDSGSSGSGSTANGNTATDSSIHVDIQGNGNTVNVTQNKQSQNTGGMKK